MIKSLMTVGFSFLLINSAHALSLSSSCFEINSELTKLGWIHSSNHRIQQEPDSYRHMEERKISMIFTGGKKNDFKVDIFDIAHECHQQDGLKDLPLSVKEISQIIDKVAINYLDDQKKLTSAVEATDKKARRSIFGKKLINDPKDSYQDIMFKTAEEKLCAQKKYIEESLLKNEFGTKKRYSVKSFQVGIKDLYCRRDSIFPEDIYCDITYVRQLDISPRN